MNFDLHKTIEILSRTPNVIDALLSDLDEDWVSGNEGGDSWSPFDVVGHLIHGEKTDWIPRMKTILSVSEKRVFQPFDRFAQFEMSKGKKLSELIEEFRSLRQKNIRYLKTLNLKEIDYKRQAIHPELGEVTLQELLATWTVHDLGHIAQISRVMAKQYKSEVGPWIAYLGILKN